MPALTASTAVAWSTLDIVIRLAPFGIAHQSQSTNPWKPKSVRSMSLSRCWLCVAFVPLTRL